MAGLPVARASLIADGGAAAAGGDFFRSREFCLAEGVTHSLVVEDVGGAQLRAPLVVRPVPAHSGTDATSPYGFPGAAGRGHVRLDEVDWSGTGLVSLFLRDRVDGSPCIDGGTRRSRVRVADPAQPLKLREQHRRHIRRNERAGYTTAIAPGVSATAGEREAFEFVYRQTMERAEAAERYLFTSEYFAGVLSAAGAWLLLTRTAGGRPAAGAIAVQSDGLLHYYLGGSSDEQLRDSPLKSTLAAMTELAREHGLPLNLGGGVREDDPLDHFKRGFSNREGWFVTHEVVCDGEAYRELSSNRDDSGWFPLYRSPS